MSSLEVSLIVFGPGTVIHFHLITAKEKTITAKAIMLLIPSILMTWY